MALDLTALEVNLHNNLESELEADRQKDETEGTRHTQKNQKPRSFFGKIRDGLKSGWQHSFTSENLAWAGTVAVASIAATLGATGIVAGIESLVPQAFANLGTVISNTFSFAGVGEVSAAAAKKFSTMVGLSAFLPVTFGFARSFRDGYEKGENSKHHPKHREHERGHAKVREHAQGHGADQQRDHERVAGTVAPIPVLTTAMKVEPAAPMHANSNAAERPAYLQNILAQGPRSQERSHVAALEEQQQVPANSRGV